MKKNCAFLLSLLVIPVIMEAQQPGSRSNTPADSVNTQLMRGRPILISQMDQRKVYHWGTGQRATPSGRQADDPRAKYARVFGDSAVVVYDPNERKG